MDYISASQIFHYEAEHCRAFVATLRTLRTLALRVALELTAFVATARALRTLLLRATLAFDFIGLVTILLGARSLALDCIGVVAILIRILRITTLRISLFDARIS